MKFAVGDKIRVTRKSTREEVYWAPSMCKAIGRVYVILEVSRGENLLLDTKADLGGYTYYFPVGGVQKLPIIKNQQLLFEFME